MCHALDVTGQVAAAADEPHVRWRVSCIMHQQMTCSCAVRWTSLARQRQRLMQG